MARSSIEANREENREVKQEENREVNSEENREVNREEKREENRVEIRDEKSKSPSIQFSEASRVTVIHFDEFIIEEDEDGDLYIPFNERFVTHPTNNAETLMHLIKGALCSGIVAIPKGFKYAGLVLGTFIILIIGSLITYCIHMLITCAYILCHRYKVPSMLYPDVMQYAMHMGPEKYKKYDHVGRLLCNIFLVVDLFLAACVSVVFIGTTIEQICETLAPNFDLTARIYMIFLLIPLILINMVGKLKWMAPFSILANLSMMTSIAMVLIFIMEDLPPIKDRTMIGKFGDLPAFISAIIFAIQCVGVTLSLENNMKNPSGFLGPPGIMYIGLSVIVLLNLLMGFFGYLKYGEDVQGSVILNLPHGSSFATVVRFLACFAIFLTHSLQMFVPIQVISHTFNRNFERHPKAVYVLVRIVLVSLSVAVAVCVPNFFPLVGFVGAVSLCALGFTFPALIEIFVYYKEPGYGKYKWRLVKNVIIIIISIILCVSGTIISIQMIWNAEAGIAH